MYDVTVFNPYDFRAGDSGGFVVQTYAKSEDEAREYVVRNGDARQLDDVLEVNPTGYTSYNHGRE